MKTSCFSRRSKLFVALALCSMALMSLPQKAQAFGFPMCPFKKNDALCSAVKVIGQDTGRMIVVVDAKGNLLSSSANCNTAQKCGNATTQKCSAAAKKCDKSKKCGPMQCPVLKQTLADGRTRTVTKKCGKKNVTATITALKNAKGQVIGAVIISNGK